MEILFWFRIYNSLNNFSTSIRHRLCPGFSITFDENKVNLDETESSGKY